MGAYWVKRVGGWYYSALNVLKPRGPSDRLVIGAADVSGSNAAGSVSIDTGSFTTRGLDVRGSALMGELTLSSSGTGALVLQEVAANLTCSTLLSASGTASVVGMYMKADKFVLAFQCGANGQIRYLTIQLDGFTCTWTAVSTAP